MLLHEYIRPIGTQVDDRETAAYKADIFSDLLHTKQR